MRRAAAPHVVVVGAGFGGLTLARELDDLGRQRPLRVTLLDKRNHHTFQPLLYQVATAGLQAQDVGQALRPMFGLRRVGTERSSVDVRLGEAVAIDREARTVELADGDTLTYDHLVVAAGADTADFGLPGVLEHGFKLKSIGDALELRDHVLRRFEVASAHADADDAELTFVVGGGGPTGVETAGALAELVDHVLRRDHPTLDLGRVRIVLVEMTDRLLPGYHPNSSAAALRELRSRGVEVLLGASLASAHADHVELEDGTTIPTRTLVWVAGVAGVGLGRTLGVEVTRGGRVPVTDGLELPDDDRVHVIGDLAAATDADGELLPQLAPVAMQQGRHVADAIAARLDGRRPEVPFSYFDKGTMATIGRNDAVAELPFGIRIYGWPAWISWLGLHLLFLVGFRNRLAVLLSWVWNYLTYDRAARLILHAEPRIEASHTGAEPPGDEPDGPNSAP